MIMIRTFKLALFALVLACGGAAASGAMIVGYDLGSSDGSIVSSPATTVAANVSASALTRGSAFTPAAVYVGGTDGSLNSASSSAHGPTTADALAAGFYAEFAVTVDSGYQLDLTSIQVFSYSQNRDRTLGVFYSLDGFATSLGDVVIENSLTGGLDTITLADNGVTGTITFRLAIAETVGAFEQRGFGNVLGSNNDIVLNGTVTAIPEPSTFMLLATSLLGPLAYTSRKRLEKTGRAALRATAC
jgi:hypothetical protein